MAYSSYVMMKKIILIGIGGSSCSGKSTLAEWLSKLFPNSFIVNQDHFYKPDSSIRRAVSPSTKETVANWDEPDALEIQSFIDTLIKIKEGNNINSHIKGDNNPVIHEEDVSAENYTRITKKIEEYITRQKREVILVLVDGFLLYDDPKIQELFDISFFLQASKATLIARRNKRKSYVTIEGFWEEPVNYFEEFVWPCYLKYNKRILEGNKDGIIVLDSDVNSIEKCTELSVDFITKIV